MAPICQIDYLSLEETSRNHSNNKKPESWFIPLLKISSPSAGLETGNELLKSVLNETLGISNPLLADAKSISDDGSGLVTKAPTCDIAILPNNINRHVKYTFDRIIICFACIRND